MPALHEMKQARTFLRGKIAAHATIISLGLADKIWRDLAPPGSDCPYIIMTLQAATDKNAIGARNRLFTRPLFSIKGVTQGTDDTVGYQIADAIEDALRGQSDFVGADGVVKLGVFREEPLDYPEYEDGIRYNHIGGLYRVFVHTP